jgi:hypothetical protein
MAGREFKPIIEPVHRCRHAGVTTEEDSITTRKPTGKEALIQPKQGHSEGCSGQCSLW